jgi:hypothetical protein
MEQASERERDTSLSLFFFAKNISNGLASRVKPSSLEGANKP